MKLPKVLAKYNGPCALIIDQGSNQTGWAILKNGTLERGLFKLKEKSVYDRVHTLFYGIQELIDTHSVEVLVFEGATIFSHQNKAARLVLCHLHYRLEELAEQNEIPCVEIHSGTMKKTVCNATQIEKDYKAGQRENRRPKKADVAQGVISLFGLDPESKHVQDEIDALAIAYTYAKNY